MSETPSRGGKGTRRELTLREAWEVIGLPAVLLAIVALVVWVGVTDWETLATFGLIAAFIWARSSPIGWVAALPALVLVAARVLRHV